MIQRIQTIYMLASVIAILMMLVFPLGHIDASDAFFSVSALGVTCTEGDVVLDKMCYELFFILLLMFVLPLVSIFLYKRRKLQMRILIYTAVLDLLFYAFFFLYESSALEQMVAGVLTLSGFSPMVETHYSVVLYTMPALSIFCCIFAIRGVLYDIALLASADRLRSSRKK